MEQSLRLILVQETKLEENVLVNVYTKLTASAQQTFAPDLYILAAERFFELPQPITRQSIEKAENLIGIYSRLQEPMNQFQIRSLICQALINSNRAKVLRGTPATETNLKAVDLMYRAMQLIQGNNLYQPLALRAVFIFYQIAFPFFYMEQRHHLQALLPISLILLEPHLTGQYDQNLELYRELSILSGCLLDDQGKSDEASKQMIKLLSLIPVDKVIERYTLFHYLVHFSRKSSGGLTKQKLDLNEQLQKAIIMYQTARSNNATTTKDLAEVQKICFTFLDAKKEHNAECEVAEIIIGETGRLAASFNQAQVAEDCMVRAMSARSQIAHFHAFLIKAELGLNNNKLTADERNELVSNLLQRIITSTSPVPDLIMIQDAAALQWTHSLQLLDKPQLIKRALVATALILQNKNSQASLLRSEIHFALAKIFEKEHDIMKALDQLKRAQQLDYLVNDHPTKLIHPFDRFLVPYYRVLNVVMDSYGQQTNTIDQAFSYIALQKKVNSGSVKKAYETLQTISTTDVSSYDAIEAAHYSTVWFELVKAASSISEDQIAVNACHQFIGIDFDPVQFDTAVEIQCDATIYGITSCFKLKDPNTEYASKFVMFSIGRAKNLKKARLSYNSIASIWNSYFSKQEPETCTLSADLLGDALQALFESDLAESKALIGQMTNFYVKVLLASSNDPAPPVTATGTGKKKGSSVDPAKQKLLKQAEDIAIKALPIVTSVYEKKALIDRLVTIFGLRNQLPPNQNDPENSTLVTLATIMNEKVQHKPETLTATYAQIQNPILFALLSERACKLDLQQVTIDSASKTIDLIPRPKDKDELYHVGLAHFYRGLAFLKMIQPDLQEFSCQDKLRSDSATDFLSSARFFHNAKSEENAKQALSYFVSTLVVGENFPKFRALLANVLVEAIEISRKVVIGDELRVRLFRTYLLVLIDSCEWPTCRKIINQAITQLDKSVHCKIWDLVLVVTANADCGKTEQPLIDEMLRVKQLGDSKYQSGLWAFVADLAHDPNVQRTALTKALDVLKPNDKQEIFTAALNLARWVNENTDDDYKDLLQAALVAISTSEPAFVCEYQFEVDVFKLKAAKTMDAFNDAMKEIDRLSADLWALTATTNTPADEDEDLKTGKKASARGSKIASHRSNIVMKESQTNIQGVFQAEPKTVAEWLNLISQIEHHKPPTVQNSYKLVENLFEIIDIYQELGKEFSMLRLWYHIMLFAKHTIKNVRFEQLILIKFKLFLDRLNYASPYKYWNDFTLTEEERAEWNQKVGRYQSDPPSNFPPIRHLLIREARMLVDLGEYKSALMIINTALNQSEILDDFVTQAKSLELLAEIQLKSGEAHRAIEYLSKSAQLTKMPLDFWVDWFSAAFQIGNCEEHLHHFQQACVKPNMSIAQKIIVNKLYLRAADYLSSEEAETFLTRQRNETQDEDIDFIPYIDLNLKYLKKILSSPNYPKSLVHYREVGRDMLGLIDVTSDNYDKISSNNSPDCALPLLLRFVEAVNMFGYLIVKYSPVISGYEINGLDINAIGSHASLLTEFMDKTQEPLPDYSPTSAIMHFNTIQNIPNIPKPQLATMNILLGQCLHIISHDNVTLQNSVRYLWKGSQMLLELQSFELAGDVANELYGVLRTSDLNGAIFQYLVAQSVNAYKMRITSLNSDFPPNYRETLYIKEMERVRSRFMNPEISQIYCTAQKYFETVPNGTTLVQISKTMTEIRSLVTNNKNCCLMIIDKIQGSSSIMAAVILLGETDSLQNVPLDINFEEAAMKFEIFKQIIATAKAQPQNNEPNPARGSSSKGRSKSKKPQKSITPVMSVAESVSFAKEALKLNNPEFTKFIEDLNTAFQPLESIMPEKEKCPETCLILSSIQDVHPIPFDCLTVFSNFATIYRDFSIMSAMNRKALSCEAPTFVP